MAIAKLNPYVGQGGSLDTGSDTFRTATLDNAIFSGLKDLGEGELEKGRKLGQAELLLSGKADAQDKMIQGLHESQVFEQLKQTEISALKEAELGADPSGKGFVAGVIKGTDERIAKYVSDGATPELQEQRKAKAEGLRTSILSQSSNTEVGLWKKGMSQAQQQAYADAGAIAGQIPNADGYNLAYGALTKKADELQLSPPVREAFLRDGRRHLVESALAGQAVNRPDEVLRTGDGIYKGLPTATASEEQKKVVRGAMASGFNAEWMLAYAKIESNFNPNVTTGGKSTAKGTLQFTDEAARKVYGVTDHTDTEGQARALGLFLSRHQARLENAGIQPTIGRLFMFHNVGQGVADALLRAGESNPDKRMGQVLFEVYGNQTTKNGELLREVVGRNNPGIYRPDMTVSQVLASYENKTGRALRDVSGIVNGESQTSQEVIRQKTSELLGFDTGDTVSFDYYNKIIGAARKEVQERTKGKADVELGYAYVSGQVRMSPNDPEHQKVVDKFVRQEVPELYDNLVKGSPEAYAEATKLMARTSYVPKPVAEAMRELIHSGNNGPQRLQAYEFMREVFQKNPTAWDASKFDSDTETRVKEYIARTQSGEDPKRAAEAIAFSNTDEGKKQRRVVQAALDGKTGEVEKLKYDDFADAVAGNWFFNRTPNAVGRNGVSSDAAQKLIEDDGRQAYRKYRESGIEPEEAKKMAVVDLQKQYGISTTLTQGTERGRIMRHPPEKFYSAPSAGMKPFETQALELVGEELKRRYPGKASQQYLTDEYGNVGGVDPEGGFHADALEVRVIPTTQTDDDVKSKRLPSYRVYYRDPKDGSVQLAPTPDGRSDWYPNYDRIREDDFKAFERAGNSSEPTKGFFKYTPKDLGNKIRDQFKPSK